MERIQKKLMWKIILEPWPWYVAGPLIGLMVPALLLLAGKSFGISSTFRNIGAMCMPKSNVAYLRDSNWQASIWQLLMAVGIIIGGFIGNHWLSVEPVKFLPEEYFSISGMIKLVIGGIMVGFGTRYAGGCTSGHTIMGLSNLSWPSLIATLSFFIGGLLMTWVIMPLLTGS